MESFMGFVNDVDNMQARTQNQLQKHTLYKRLDLLRVVVTY